MLRRHVEDDVSGAEVICAAGGFAGAFDIAVGDDALDPAVGVHEEIELSGSGCGLPAGIGGSDLRMALGDGVARTEIGVKLDGNFISGERTAALADVGRSIELDHAIVAADFHAAAGGGDGQAAAFVGRREVELHVVSEADDFFLRTVDHSVGMACALRETELHWRGGGGVAGFAIEGEITRGDLQIFVGRLAGSWRGAGKIDLDVALAYDVSGGGLVIAFAGVNVVVAAAVVAVNGDPDVLEEGAILVFILGGVRGADGEESAALVCADVGEFGGLLLDRCGDGGRGVLASARGTDGALGIDAGDDEDDDGCSPCGPTCVAR